MFADLEGQLDEVERVERDAEVVDRTQREQALVHLGDRLRASIGRRVEIRAVGAGDIGGEVVAVGPDWLTLTGPGQVETLVPMAVVLTVKGMRQRGVAAASPVVARLGLGYAIRLILREKAQVSVILVDGRRLDGIISQVGADYFELAISPDEAVGLAQRPDRTCVTFSGLGALRRR